MRYLITSDLHANWEALEAVLEHARGAYDQILCCGDVVGYAADPNRAVDWVRDNVRLIVRGNHDKAVAGMDDLEWFNPVAQQATLWTREALTPANLDYLRGLPRGPLEVDGFQIMHGSPLDEDDYIISSGQAMMALGFVDTAVSFFGHTHLQGGFFMRRNGSRQIDQVHPAADRSELVLSENEASLINPGSVGQPRDGDPRAAYCIYSPEERMVTLFRVPYDVRAAQRKIVEAGLPEVLAQRLGVGA
ncbi:MAG: metallophosphoesterase family protein [Bryobacteraceae bacterium]|nr:metallophosphoesterase family protein [Bryobacteraceae bacterium]